MKMIQIGDCLINIELVTYVYRKKRKVTVAFNDRFSLLELKDDEATRLWDWYQKQVDTVL